VAENVSTLDNQERKRQCSMTDARQHHSRARLDTLRIPWRKEYEGANFFLPNTTLAKASALDSVGAPTCSQFQCGTKVPNQKSYRFFPPPFFAARSSMTACAAANRAIGTMNGDALT
jgi:hypothetical protein